VFHIVVIPHVLRQTGGIILGKVDIGLIGNPIGLRFEQSSRRCFPLCNHSTLAEVVLDHGQKLSEIGFLSYIIKIYVFCSGFDEVIDCVETLMCLEEFGTADVVVAAGEGGFYRDLLGVRVDF